MKVLKKMLLFFKYQMTSCFIAWHVTALIMFMFICGLFFNRRGFFETDLCKLYPCGEYLVLLL